VNKTTLKLVWKLVIASLLVGLGLDYFNISPADLIHDIPDTVSRVYDAVIRLVTWGGKYVLLGAIIVVPVWLLTNLTSLKDKFKRRN